MRAIVTTGLLLATLAGGLPAKAAERVGVTTTTIAMPVSDRALDVTLWYPAKVGGTPVRVGDNAVFEGIEGLKQEDGNGAICQDSGGQGREVVHARLTELIADGLARALRPTP